MPSAIYSAIKQISEEKGISVESVIATIEAALAAAYRKDFGEKNQNIKVEFEPKTGGSRVFDVKTVMEKPEEEEGEDMESEDKEAEEVKGEETNKDSEEEVSEEDLEPKFNPKLNITPEEAQEIKKDAKIGDEIKIELDIPEDYGRMAAQTAKQVITQKLREVERQTIFDEFKDKEGDIINGTVQRREGRVILVDLGRASAILIPEDQVPGERYTPGARFKFYIRSVDMGTKGPEILLSRTHPDIVKKLFTVEIPEIADGSIEIKAVAREAGSRTKIAVSSEDESIDPIGSCVGQRGTRVQTIISELGGEKIDIIEYEEDSEKFIINSLSPAKVSRLELNDKEKKALAVVKADQLSLAIGKGGQNVRLAAKLTGWKIDIAEEKEDGEVEKVDVKEKAEEVKEKDTGEEKKEETDEKSKNKDSAKGKESSDDKSQEKKSDDKPATNASSAEDTEDKKTNKKNNKKEDK